MNIEINAAAIVCGEIAQDNAPILYAYKSLPEDEADSGWQFLCGKDEENWELAKVWSLNEVLEYEPSLMNFIELPTGTILERDSVNSPWKSTNEDE